MSKSRENPLTITEDRKFFERELADFVPDKVFDAHLDLWHPEQFDGPLPGLPDVLSHENYREVLDFLHLGRLIPWYLKEQHACGHRYRPVTQLATWIKP